MINTRTFFNGLKLVHEEIGAFRSVSIGVYVGTGSVNESAETNGISHFIEHVNFKGTHKRSASEIAEAIENLGAQINAFTSKQMTAYYTVSLDNHAEECCEVLSDLFFDSVFDKEELDKERGVILEEIAMCEDTPDDACLELLSEAYYGEHKLAMPILGSAENVNGFSKEDIEKYLSQHYCSENTVVSIVGNISFDRAVELTEKYFVENFRYKTPVKYDMERREPHYCLLKKEKPISQANLAVGFPALKFDDENEPALMIMNNALGGGMSSRLFQRIREQAGLVYSVYSYPSAYSNDGLLTLYLGTNPDSVLSAVDMLKSELDKFIDQGITEKEMSRAREQMKSAYVFSQESPRSLMNLYGKYMIMTGKVIDIEKRLSDVDNVSVRQVNELIARVFDYSKAAFAYVGKPIEGLEEITEKWQA
ncbi:MAG: M16 family metallopeptidase [Christensenellales bacterium]